MKMSSVAVFVFLLDNLTGFNNALNDTLFQNAKFTHSEDTPIMKECDPFTTDQILSAVNQKLGIALVPSYRRDANQLDNEQIDEQASEILDTVLIDNSLPEPDVSRSFDENKSKFDNDFNSFSRRSYVNSVHRNTEKVINETETKTKIRFPNSAPFLVAIFETLANLTAQTCAGTLLSSRWVLTAANCINVLSSLYANNTNMTEHSHYTIVAESSNPLLDGSAHNVTQVVLHPHRNASRSLFESEDVDEPYLVLMKIEPGVEGHTMEVMKGKVESGDVMAYGWILSKNESNPEHDSMECSSVSSQILSPADCQELYSYEGHEVFCLSSRDMEKNVTQLSTGGPVLLVHDGEVKVLGVVQTDEQVFIAYSVAAHYDWIVHTISNKL